MKQTYNFGTENTENYELQQYEIDHDFIEDFFFLRCVKGENIATLFTGFYTFEKEEGYEEPLLARNDFGSNIWSYYFVGLNFIWLKEFQNIFIKELKKACADFDNLTVVVECECKDYGTIKPIVHLKFYTRVSK